MAGKQVEGDNRERRKAAKEAKDRGESPSEAKVTQGSSKQRHSLGGKADIEQRQETPTKGKREPKPRPS